MTFSFSLGDTDEWFYHIRCKVNNWNGATRAFKLLTVIRRGEITDVKCGRMQKKIPPRLVCGAYLDCILPGVHVTAGLAVFQSFK